MIQARHLTLRRGTQVLLDDTEFTVHAGEHLGIVGRNGAGKSSLFALLRCEIEADAGTLDMPPGWRLTSVEQIVHGTERSAREFVIDGDHHLRALQAQRGALGPDDGMAIAELEAQLVQAQAYSAPARAEQLLAGLGFGPEEWGQPVAQFSGGWQMRIALARALMRPADLLLLDEPTNHLDLDAMLWLERWLREAQATVLVISHDTAFLDRVAQGILHFEGTQLVRYKGGYEAFVTQRAERARQNARAHQRQAQESAHLQAFIDRFRAKATKARQVQSRVKALARMQALAPLASNSRVALPLPAPERTPEVLFRLQHAELGYPATEGHAAHPVLHDVNLTLRAGARVGVLGANGAGKSTLAKALVGELMPLAGSHQPAKGLVIGYFAQQQLDQLVPTDTPLEHLHRLAPEVREQALRDHLGRYGFDGDMATHPVAPLSGGEKARLAFALMVWNRPNLLVLDEPSNHLDVDTREALARSLAEFPGSVLLISHDRHLLQVTADAFWIVADGAVAPFDGDLDDYAQWSLARRSAASAARRAESPAADRRAQRRAEAQARAALAARRRPLQREAQALEARMATQQARLQEIEALMAQPDFYTDAWKAQRPELLAEHGQLHKAVGELEDAWLAVQARIEALDLEAAGDAAEDQATR